MAFPYDMEQNLEKHGADGIDVSIYIGPINDTSNYQIKISGSQIYSQLNSKLNSSEITYYYTKSEINENIFKYIYEYDAVFIRCYI